CKPSAAAGRPHAAAEPVLAGGRALAGDRGIQFIRTGGLYRSLPDVSARADRAGLDRREHPDAWFCLPSPGDDPLDPRSLAAHRFERPGSGWLHLGLGVDRSAPGARGAQDGDCLATRALTWVWAAALRRRAKAFGLHGLLASKACARTGRRGHQLEL